MGLLSEDLTPFREPDADVLPIVVDDSATAGTTSPPPVDLFGSYPTALGDSLSRSETDNDSGSRRRKRRRRGRVLSGDFDGDDTETISSDDGSGGYRPGRYRRRGSKGRSPRSRRRRQQRKRSGADVEEESEEPVHDEDQDESSSVVADMESGARKRCMLYPSTPFKNVLDAVVSVILLYILLVIPYRVSFDADSEGLCERACVRACVRADCLMKVCKLCGMKTPTLALTRLPTPRHPHYPRLLLCARVRDGLCVCARPGARLPDAVPEEGRRAGDLVWRHRLALPADLVPGRLSRRLSL